MIDLEYGGELAGSMGPGGGGRLPGRWGVGGWDAATQLGTALGAGVIGSAANGVFLGVVYRLNAVPTAAQYLAHYLTGAPLAGYYMRYTAAAASEFIAANGVGTANAPVRSLVAGDVGKIHIDGISCDGAAVFHYFDNAQVGASTALAGFQPAGAAVARQNVGQFIGNNPAVDFTILGIFGRNSHLTLADFQTICAASKLAGGPALGGVSMDHAWIPPQQPDVPASFPDSIGADSLTFQVGVPANLTMDRVLPLWGF